MGYALIFRKYNMDFVLSVTRFAMFDVSFTLNWELWLLEVRSGGYLQGMSLHWFSRSLNSILMLSIWPNFWELMHLGWGVRLKWKNFKNIIWVFFWDFQVHWANFWCQIDPKWNIVAPWMGLTIWRSKCLEMIWVSNNRFIGLWNSVSWHSCDLIVRTAAPGMWN